MSSQDAVLLKTSFFHRRFVVSRVIKLCVLRIFLPSLSFFPGNFFGKITDGTVRRWKWKFKKFMVNVFERKPRHEKRLHSNEAASAAEAGQRTAYLNTYTDSFRPASQIFSGSRCEIFPSGKFRKKKNGCRWRITETNRRVRNTFFPLLYIHVNFTISTTPVLTDRLDGRMWNYFINNEASKGRQIGTAAEGGCSLSCCNIPSISFVPFIY